MKKIIAFPLILILVMVVAFFLSQYFGYTPEIQMLWLKEKVENIHPLVLSLILILLLMVDLVFPVFSSVVMVFSGMFLGLWVGTLVNLIGSLSANGLGYILCRQYGRPAYERWCGETDPKFEKTFYSWAPLALLLSRGAPMMSEMLSCLAGLWKMPFGSFFLYSILGTVPICFLYAWTGSQNYAAEDVGQLFFIALGGPAVLWLIFKGVSAFLSAKKSCRD